MSDNMHGFKVYNPGLICRGHKYEENTVYKKSGHGICVSGVTHYCVNPFDVLDYYPLIQPDGQFSDFTTVEAIEPPVTDDNKKFATSMIYIGIDPGKNGGLAILNGEEVQTFRYDRDTYRCILSDLRGEPAMCCLEQVSAMPGQGVTSMFRFGEGFGWLQGTLEAYGIPYELVRPQKWKKEFSVTADKNTSIAVCKRMFPTLNLVPPNCRKEHDGMAEAVLMAVYAKRRL